MKNNSGIIFITTIFLWGLIFPLRAFTQLKVYPAPSGAHLNNSFSLYANNEKVACYSFKVNPGDKALRAKALGDLIHGGDYFENAAFAYFDMQGTVNIKITSEKKIHAARVLPASAAIVSSIQNNALVFKITRACNIVVEINGDDIKSLQIFANPLETNIPKPNAANVLYYGPGVHNISSVTVGDNKTVYLAGGAILHAVIDPAEKFTINPGDGLRHYAPIFNLIGKNIKFMGRGVIDASDCPIHSRDLLQINGENIEVRGIILQDGPIWMMPVRRSVGVLINNVKILGYRANSDGIDICSSQTVSVRNCYIRSNDDLVVVKTNDGPGGVRDVKVEGCVLWNQLARALSIGAEILHPVNTVLFSNCDIIHDKGIEWSMGIDHSDSSTVSNVRFENIRVEEAHKFISVWIGKSQWSTNKAYGHVQNVVFDNINAKGSPLTIEVAGADSQHLIKDVSFKNVVLNGKQLVPSMINKNQFVNNIAVLKNN